MLPTATQCPVTVLQMALWQSPSSAHPCPSAQVATSLQLPPQSTSASSSSFAKLWHLSCRVGGPEGPRQAAKQLHPYHALAALKRCKLAATGSARSATAPPTHHAGALYAEAALAVAPPIAALLRELALAALAAAAVDVGLLVVYLTVLALSLCGRQGAGNVNSARRRHLQACPLQHTPAKPLQFVHCPPPQAADWCGQPKGHTHQHAEATSAAVAISCAVSVLQALATDEAAGARAAAAVNVCLPEVQAAIVAGILHGSSAQRGTRRRERRGLR